MSAARDPERGQLRMLEDSEPVYVTYIVVDVARLGLTMSTVIFIKGRIVRYSFTPPWIRLDPVLVEANK